MAGANSKLLFDAMLETLSAGNWFSIHRAMLEELGPSKAVLLHFLIDYHRRMQMTSSYQWKEGWFFCQIDVMKKETTLSSDRQQRLLNDLVSDGVLQAKLMGIPARRFFKINAEAVSQIVVDWTQKQREERQKLSPDSSETSLQDSGESSFGKIRKLQSGKSGTYIVRPRNSKTKIDKDLGGTSESAPSVRKGFLSTEFDDKAAALLREVLVMHDSDLVAPPRGVRLATLSKSIKSLRLSGRTTATEHNILEVIKWLRKNYGDEHTPKMHKANDFADHWERFRSAWIRDVGEDAVVSAKSSSPEDREARVAKHELKKLVVDKIVEQQGRNAMFDFRDRDIRRALVALGEDPDTLTEKDWEL